MKYIKSFIKECVNYHNIQSLTIFSLLVLLVTDSWIKTLICGAAFILVLVIVWEIVKWTKRHKQ